MATHSQKDSSKAKVEGRSAQMMTEYAVLLVGGLVLAPKPGIFAILALHEMDEPLIGCKLTSVPDPGQRLQGWWCC